MSSFTIALVGDYSPDVIAHRAIPIALDFARKETAAPVEWTWVHTREIRNATRDLSHSAAVWLVPASPYENMDGALAAIRFARETKRPFLGTCGGFQHALIEFARDVAGLLEADHAETNSAGDTLVIAPLACSLVGKTGDVHFAPGSRLGKIYGRDTAHEGYHCNYGLNPAHRRTLESAGLMFTAFDERGEIRGAELPSSAHPFFIGTLFQPERAALGGATPPLVRAFVAAATNAKIA
jgi:CTP synthase (UTP-ammonia lyase)